MELARLAGAASSDVEVWADTNRVECRIDTGVLGALPVPGNGNGSPVALGDGDDGADDPDLLWTPLSDSAAVSHD